MKFQFPEMLLKQQQRTKSVFNFVLGAIAGISLPCWRNWDYEYYAGFSNGAHKRNRDKKGHWAKTTDIAYQFIIEAILISFSGGIVGVIVGITIAITIASLADIPTIINGYSILVSFGVAVSIGIIFGYAPARKAASQDPIMSLRYE